MADPGVADQWAQKEVQYLSPEELAADRKRREEERKARKKAALAAPFRKVGAAVKNASADERDKKRWADGHNNGGPTRTSGFWGFWFFFFF